MTDPQNLLFAEEDGPTALRPDLARTLAFSEAERIRTSWGDELCCAAVAAVWNGRRGYVAVLVRHLERPLVRRFVYRSKIRSAGLLDRVMEDAAAFAAGLGLTLDAPAYADLDEDGRALRLRAWNQVRKLSHWPERLGIEENPDALVADETATPPIPDDLGDTTDEIATPRLTEDDTEPVDDRAVLGRVAVVRRVDATDGIGTSLRGRVLSFF